MAYKKETLMWSRYYDLAKTTQQVIANKSFSDRTDKEIKAKASLGIILFRDKNWYLENCTSNDLEKLWINQYIKPYILEVYKGKNGINELLRNNLREIKKLEKRWKVLAWVIVGIFFIIFTLIIPQLSNECTADLAKITIFVILGIPIIISFY